VAQRGRRQKRKRRQRERREGAPAAEPRPSDAEPRPSGPGSRASGAEARPSGADAMSRGYSRARAKDAAARAALEPLEPGERPTAVTVGAVVASLLCVANVVALIVGFDTGEGASRPGLAIFGALILGLVAYGMWRARYWAVLGMQTLLALAFIGSALAAVSAENLAALVLVLGILVPSGLLFWFLIKAMARLQMPERPGAR
jgi:hypothetical protein